MSSELRTTIEQVLGSYEGKRFARASGDLVHVVVSRRYACGEHVIIVGEIAAIMHCETGRVYVLGPLALAINREIEEIYDSIPMKDAALSQNNAYPLLRDIPLTITLDASKQRVA